MRAHYLLSYNDHVPVRIPLHASVCLYKKRAGRSFHLLIGGSFLFNLSWFHFSVQLKTEELFKISCKWWTPLSLTAVPVAPSLTPFLLFAVNFVGFRSHPFPCEFNQNFISSASKAEFEFYNHYKSRRPASCVCGNTTPCASHAWAPAAGECGADRVRGRQFGGTLQAWFSLENYLLREAVSLCLMQLCSSASWLQNRGRKSKRGTETEAESVGRINSENVDQRRERKRSDGLDGRV